MVDLTGYRLTYDDEFNARSISQNGVGTSYRDIRAEWRYDANSDIGFGRSSFLDSRSGYDPFSVQNGVLTITAAPPGTSASGYPGSWQSGLISTQGNFSQTYGYFEIRADFSDNPDAWDAFWLLPNQQSAQSSSANGHQELDVVEHYGNNDRGVYSTIHTTDPQPAGTTWQQTRQVYSEMPNPTGYHTYGMNWQADRISFYVDGQLVGSQATPSDLHSPMYLLANLAVQSTATTGTRFSSSIDYIRVYSNNPNAVAVPQDRVSSPDGRDPGLYGATAGFRSGAGAAGTQPGAAGSNSGSTAPASGANGSNGSSQSSSGTAQGTAAPGNAPCYCTGTSIRTDRGDVAVERLAVGDRVVTAAGLHRPIRWIGRRTYPGSSAPPTGRPVRIRAGAFHDGVPARDLLVSPDHAVWLDGLFVAAGHLVNGTSITRGEAVIDLTYWHVELDSHDLLMAEGTPAESFLPMPGIRRLFDGPGAEDRSIDPRPYAPRIGLGPPLVALRRRLIRRSGAASAPAQPGAIRAWLDRCVLRTDGALRVAGWAHDGAQPGAPVCLDIVVDGTIVAVTVAAEYRADIAAAGVGDGRHGFDLGVDAPLSRGVPHVVEVRRSADEAVICAMAADAAGVWRPLLAA
ncbi:Hint domain-containing protein [Methylobacterium sp. C33D]